MNSYYQPGAGRSAQVDNLFGKIAPRYDFINDLQSLGLHRRWKQKLIELTNVSAGQSALDVCAGTGDLAIGLARRGAKVIALDANEKMLELAKERAEQENVALQFLRGDAENLPFEDARFDAVTIGYGLRNLSNWKRGLHELTRVTSKGGTISILDFGKPPSRVWRAIFFTYLRTAVPVFGRVFAKDWNAYAYILESLEAYPAASEISLFLKALGCEKVELYPIIGGAMTIHHAIR